MAALKAMNLDGDQAAGLLLPVDRNPCLILDPACASRRKDPLFFRIDINQHPSLKQCPVHRFCPCHSHFLVDGEQGLDRRMRNIAAVKYCHNHRHRYTVISAKRSVFGLYKAVFHI